MEPEHAVSMRERTSTGSFLSSGRSGGVDFSGANTEIKRDVVGRDQITIQSYYGGILAAEVREPDLGEAEVLFAQLSLDTVPEPGPLPARSWMRMPRNSLFVGREQDLKLLAQIIKAGETAAIGQIAAATGLGGIGKTQLAAEFVHRYGRFFGGGVFWLNCAKAEDVPSEVVRCGGAGGLALDKAFDALPQPQQLAMVLSAWCSALPRLLVFDNCEDLPLLKAWRPPYGGSRVLLTCRRSNWPGSLGLRAIALNTLAPAESLALLRKHRPDLPENNPSLAGIAEALGHLPLALHLAGSYLERYRYDPEGAPSAYLAELRRPDLLSHTSLIGGEESPTEHELHVANTFALSFGRLDVAVPVDALARAALFRASCLAPGVPIPRALMRASLELSTDDAASSRLVSDALARAVELGLVEQQADGALVTTSAAGSLPAV